MWEWILREAEENMRLKRLNGENSLAWQHFPRTWAQPPSLTTAANPSTLLGWFLEAWTGKSDGAAPLLQGSIEEGIKKLRKVEMKKCIYRVR